MSVENEKLKNKSVRTSWVTYSLLGRVLIICCFVMCVYLKILTIIKKLLTLVLVVSVDL